MRCWRNREYIHTFHYIQGGPSIFHVETQHRDTMNRFALAPGLLPHAPVQLQQPLSTARRLAAPGDTPNFNSSQPNGRHRSAMPDIYYILIAPEIHSNAGTLSISCSGDIQNSNKTHSARHSQSSRPEASEPTFIVPPRSSAAVPIRRPQAAANQYQSSSSNTSILEAPDSAQQAQEQHRLQGQSTATSVTVPTISQDDSMPLSKKEQRHLSRDLKRTSRATEGSSGWDSSSPAKGTADGSTDSIGASADDRSNKPGDPELCYSDKASSLVPTFAKTKVQDPASMPKDKKQNPNDAPLVTPTKYDHKSVEGRCSSLSPRSSMERATPKSEAINNLDGASDRSSAVLHDNHDAFTVSQESQPAIGREATASCKQTSIPISTPTKPSKRRGRPNTGSSMYDENLDELLAKVGIPNKAQERLRRLKAASDQSMNGQGPESQSRLTDSKRYASLDDAPIPFFC